MADGNKSGSSELLLSYQQFIAELVGARLAAKLTSKPPTAVAGAIAAVGLLPALEPLVGPLMAAMYVKQMANKPNKNKETTTARLESEQSLAKEIVEDVKDCINDSNNIVYFSEYRQRIDGNKKDIPIELELAIEEFVSDIETDKTLDKISRDVIMGKFADRFGKRPDESERPAALSEAAAESASEKFCLFLERQGLAKPEAARIANLHATFVKKELPELSVLAAVQELRDQFNPIPVKPKKPYPGKRVYPDAKKFLRENYGNEINNGQMTTGKLKELDDTLYVTLRRELNDGESIVDLVEPRGKPYAKRVTACALILGTQSPEEAGRFFGGIRADRIAKHDTAKKSFVSH